ncbi:MAG: AcrB/AcrD/AcrF family protein [Sphingomonas sp.]
MNDHPLNEPAPGADGHSLRTLIDRRWRALTLAFWLGTALWYFYWRWPQVYWLALGDTDDNMRLMQVRALLAGQGWYDLRQYRMDPPYGFDIHWTRLVDLPIAGLILLLRPFVGNPMAERLACGIAPLLPLSITMLGLSATARRLISPIAWPLALIFLLGCTATMMMYTPERIDHHGWQIASLAVTIAGLVDRDVRRGGVLVGLASAFSLSIGLEMLPYAGIAGAVIALRWAFNRQEAAGVQSYGASLAGGSAIGYLLFASQANQVARCDALTPVWLSAIVAAGAFLFLLAAINPRSAWFRLMAGAVAGAILVGGFAWFFPQCLGRPEQISPELARNWFANIREAKPIYQHPFRAAFPIATLPVIGIAGTIFATWRARGTALFIPWLSTLLFTTLSAALLLWQVRVAAAAMMLAVPGATALGWVILPWCLNSRFMLVRVFGTVGGFLAVSGLFAGFSTPYLPAAKISKRVRAINHAGASCTSYSAMSTLNRLPPQVVFTFIDLGPRLITLTHHDAIAGPYHRNGEAILDVQHAFGGTPDNFRDIARKHGATLLLICPDMAESTLYEVRNKGGFYTQIANGKVPPWLKPIDLPAKSPYKLWQITYAKLP